MTDSTVKAGSIRVVFSPSSPLLKILVVVLLTFSMVALAALTWVKLTVQSQTEAIAAEAAAVTAIGSDRTTAGDGDAAAAVDTAAAVVAVGSDRTAGDGEAAAAGDAAAVDVALQRVVAIQLNRGIAAAGHTHGGFVPAAGVDVHILECDLDLVVLTVGLDGHGVGRSFVRFLICDDGVGVLHILLIPL